MLRNLVFESGDCIVHFSTIYTACEKAVKSLCESTAVSAACIPLIYGSIAVSPTPSDVVEVFTKTIVDLRAQGRVPRIAIFDIITSQPGVVMPYAALTRACAEHGVLSLIDGAHGLGCTPLNLGELDPDFFVTNAHKWGLTPRHCAVFVVAERVQAMLRTSFPTSHGWEPLPAAINGAVRGKPVRLSPFPPAPGEESPFAKMFAFTGTLDISSYLVGPVALKFFEVVCGGQNKAMEYCARLAAEGGAEVATLLDTEMMDDKEGSLTQRSPMVNIRLPLRPPPELATEGTSKLGDEHPVVRIDQRGSYCVSQWMEGKTSEEFDTFIMVFWHGDAWWTRLSAQVYLDLNDFRFAADCLLHLCRRVEQGEHLTKSVL